MVPLRSRAAMALAAVVSLVVGVALARLGPPPSADVARGTEELFASGLHARELSGPDHRPQRWTRDHARFLFRDLPEGPLDLEVVVHGHRAPVFVTADGVILGTIDVGRRRGRFTVPSRAADDLVVGLDVDAFDAGGGRRLGTLLDRVAVEAPAERPSARLALAFLAPALCVVAGGLAAGLGPWAALLTASALSILQALALVPGGAGHSGYATTLSLVLCAGAAASCAFARWCGRRWPGAGAWGFPALLVAVLVQVVAGAAPTMVVSDAQFHAHKLMAVAHGDLFPTSLTPGAKPFRFPYGVAFYALLAPLEWAGAEPVAVVRLGAAIAGAISAAALFLLLVDRSPRAAAFAVVALQLLPVTFDLFSFGNLSNVFGQAVTVVFFLWWTRPRGGAVAGGALLAVAALSHLSCFVVLGALAVAFGAVRGRDLLRDRVRLGALALGLGIAAAYYATFVGLVVSQIPRLGDRAGGRSIPGALARQALLAARQWGLPAMVLVIPGWPALRRQGLDRDLLAFWLAGVALAVVAAATPLEVRYLHALTLPVAVAAGVGLDRLWSRGWAARSAGLALGLWQAALAGQGILEGVVSRYRPS